MHIINLTDNITKKDIFNARSASVKLADEVGSINVIGCAIAEDTDTETGEIKEIGYIFTRDIVYGTVSKTAIDGILMLIDMYKDGERDLVVTVLKRKSAAGREFISLKIE